MSRFIFLFFLFVFCSGEIFAQRSYKNIPFYLSYSIKGITKNLCKDAPNDSVKIRAIYVWITRNIRYDIKAWLRYSEKKYTPARIIRRRKVVCQGYSDLFIRMCQLAGIKALEVTGYDKGIDHKTGQRFYWEEHTWNAVKIKQTWYMLDLTWSSGYIKIRERPVRKFLFQNFGIPYLNNKLRFVRAPNDNYYLKSAEAMFADHLPADPVFQLRKEPVPIEVFEGYKEDSLNLFEKNLDFSAELDTLKYLSYFEASACHAGKANSVNKRNNRIVGFAYTSYAGEIMKSLPPSPETNPGEQIGNCQVANKYFKDAIIYLGKFRRDNATVHNINMDSIKIRNTIIQSNVRRFQNINRSSRIKDFISIRQLKKNIRGYYESIHNLSMLYNKKASDNMNKIKRNINPKKYKPELIGRWKSEIEINHRKMDILADTALWKDENIDGFIDSMQVLSSKAKETYDLSYPLIYENTELNINNASRGYLIANYSRIAENKKLKDQYLQKRNGKALIPLAIQQKERYNSLSKIIRLISVNKKKIAQIKKMSMSNQGEDLLYEKENEKLLDFYNRTLAYYDEKIKIGNIEMGRMKTELVNIKAEKKLFNRQLKIQAMKYNSQIARENIRFRLFNRRADIRINFCKQGIRLAEQRIRVLNKILKK